MTGCRTTLRDKQPIGLAACAPAASTSTGARLRHSCIRVVFVDGRRAPGQSLVLVALLMPVLVALVLTFVEIGTRLLQRSEAEDVLRHASRSAIQTFAYAPFAAGTAEVREADMLQIATSTFAINLGGVHGLLTTPQQTAADVSWQPVLSENASCAASGAPAVEVVAPALCAEVELRLRGLTGWGEWRTRLFVVETLDQVR